MKRLLLTVAFTAATLAASPATAAPRARQDSEAQTKLMREAKVSKERAQETALKRVPGKVESAELERERRLLVWSFDIRNSKGTITEVQVSAITGHVVRVERESRKQEADEKRKEAGEKH
jgi:uncharacterized membrane protein YkoI